MNSFDCGPEDSAVEQGFLPLSPQTLYSRSLGAGWLVPPTSAFRNRKSRVLDDMTADGVSSSGEIAFRADLAPGKYLVTVTVGGADEQFRGMKVMANGKTLAGKITTPFFRLPYRSISRLLEIKDSALVVRILPDPEGIIVDNERRVSLEKISVAPDSIRVALNGIDIRPVVPSPAITFTSLLDADTAAVAEALRSLRRNPESRLRECQIRPLEQFLRAFSMYEGRTWSHVRQSTGLSYFTRLWMADDLLEQVVADTGHVLRDRALFLLGKVHYWLDREEHDPYHSRRASECFAELRQRHPANPLLRMYMEERLEHPLKIPPAPTGAPSWAVAQREAMVRLIEVIHWWVDHQSANGEMGGGYGDDVEMLRDWYPALLGAGDSLARLGFGRLADGVWNSGLLNHGYLSAVQDVEHSSEYVSDTQPGMLLLEYGKPEYVERSLLAIRNFRDVWSGVNRYGHRHFFSSYIGADSVVKPPPFGVDNTMNSRAMKLALWGTWYNHNTSGMDLLSQWGKAWVADAMREERGKPRGLLPPAVAYETDAIGGYGPSWHDPALGWNYYRWESLNGVTQMYDFLVGLHTLTGDTAFLAPLRLTAALASADSLSLGPIEKGNAAWAADLLRSTTRSGRGRSPEIVSTVLRARDQSPGQFGKLSLPAEDPYAQFRRTGKVRPLIDACAEISDGLRYNFEMRTSEVRYTDRVEIPPIQVLYSMYTGGYGKGNEFPSAAVTWEGTGTDVGILVTESSDTALGFLAYAFDSTKGVTARVWKLYEGSAEFTIGFDVDGDGVADTLSWKGRREVRERGARLAFAVPGGKVVVGRVRIVRRSAEPPFPRADVALSGFRIGDGVATVVLHNIGSGPARNVRVVLFAEREEIARQTVAHLEAPNDLVPKSVLLQFQVRARPGRLTCEAVVDQPEICYSNNQISQSVR